MTFRAPPPGFEDWTPRGDDDERAQMVREELAAVWSLFPVKPFVPPELPERFKKYERLPRLEIDRKPAPPPKEEGIRILFHPDPDFWRKDLTRPYNEWWDPPQSEITPENEPDVYMRAREQPQGGRSMSIDTGDEQERLHPLDAFVQNVLKGPSMERRPCVELEELEDKNRRETRKRKAATDSEVQLEVSYVDREILGVPVTSNIISEPSKTIPSIPSEPVATKRQKCNAEETASTKKSPWARLWAFLTK